MSILLTCAMLLNIPVSAWATEETSLLNAGEAAAEEIMEVADAGEELLSLEAEAEELLVNEDSQEEDLGIPESEFSEGEGETSQTEMQEDGALNLRNWEKV